eukprot:875594-Pelagomonas_calceolata.AAC.6
MSSVPGIGVPGSLFPVDCRKIPFGSGVPSDICAQRNALGHMFTKVLKHLELPGGLWISRPT